MSTNPRLYLSKAPRYTVAMLGAFSAGLDINGVCHVVRDALERGLIPVIEITLRTGNDKEGKGDVSTVTEGK